MENKEQSFSFTYSAKEQEEINKIRNKYLTKEENKMDTLKRLDESVTKKANTVSIIIGVIGVLVLGFGMSLFMSDLNTVLGLSLEVAILVGVITGVIGIILTSLAYPLYNKTVKKERERIAPEIIRLTDELLK